MSVMTEEQILNSIIPEPKIEQITLETTTDRKTRVTIKFSISDVVDDDAIGTWFEQIEYEKYFLPSIELAYSYGPIEEDDDEFLEKQNFSITGINKPDTDFIALDGSRVNKFSFDYSYVFDKQPYYLRARIYSRFDIEQLEKEEGIDLFFLNNDAGRGQYNRKLKTAVLIENYTVKYPLQDFRARNFVTTFALDEDQIINTFTSSYKDAMHRFEEKERQSKDFLSNLMITRNAQGEAKFLFIFDALSFFKRKSEYRSYFMKMTSQERVKVLRSTNVRSLRILRKRVKVIQGTNGNRSVIDFPDQDTIETIAFLTKPSNSDTFVEHKTTLGAAKAVRFSFDESEDAKAVGLHFITGTDYDIANRTDGVYAYGVSIDIVDNVKKVLRERIENFMTQIQEIEEMYTMLTLPENYDALTNLPKRSVSQILEGGPVWSSYTNSLKEIIRMFAPGYQEMDKVSSFFKLFEENPSMLSPEAVETLIDIMRIAAKNALASIGESRGIFIGKQKRTTIDLSMSTEKFYTSPRKLFDANVPKRNGREYLANFSEEISSDVLNEISSLASETGEVGLKVINGAKFEKRLETEITKFFTTTDSIPTPFLDNDPPVSLTSTGSSYLSPSAFLQPFSNPLITTNVSDTRSARSVLSANVLSTGNLDNIARMPGTPEFILTGGSKEAAFLSQFGAVFSNSEEAKTVLKNEVGKERAITRNISINVDVDVLNRTMITESNEARKDFEAFVFSKFAKVMSTPNLGTERTLANTETNDSLVEVDVSSNDNLWAPMTPTQRRTQYSAAPNQIKALSLVNSLQSNSTKMNSLSTSQGEYKVSTDFLIKMEYLTGFLRTTDFLFSVGNPKWRELTLDVYRKNKGKNLLCRMKPWAMEEMGVRTTNTGSPIYDSVFIIKPVEDFTTTETADLSAFDRPAFTNADHFHLDSDYEIFEQQLMIEIAQARSTIDSLEAENEALTEDLADLIEKRNDLNQEVTHLNYVINEFNRNRRDGTFPWSASDELNPETTRRRDELSREYFRTEGLIQEKEQKIETNNEIIREKQSEVTAKSAQLEGLS